MRCCIDMHHQSIVLLVEDRDRLTGQGGLCLEQPTLYAGPRFSVLLVLTIMQIPLTGAANALRIKAR